MTAPDQVEQQPLWQLVLVEGIFVVIAAIIIYLRHTGGLVVFRLPLALEVAVGIPVGGVLGSLAGFGLLRSPLRQSVVRGAMPLRSVAGAVWSVVVVGLLAGVGEELLFRAALLPWIGLWWAAILFALAHSGTAQLQEGITVGKAAYLLVAVVAGVLLGFLYQWAGLLASMSAHAAFDIGILLVLAPALARTATGDEAAAA
jgi:uncharacterized protein